MNAFLFLLLLSCQPEQYDCITVEKLWIEDVVSIDGVDHGRTVEVPLSAEMAKSIASEFLAQLAEKEGYIVPEVESCEELDKKEYPQEKAPIWLVRFGMSFQGTRIDDSVFLVVTNKRIYPGGWGFLYNVTSGTKLKECRNVSEEVARSSLCSGVMDGSGDSHHSDCVLELVWHYKTLPVGSENILFRYWKYIDVLDEGGVVSLMSYCDGSVIPDYVN